jgi:hypothetical protein
MYKLLGKLIVVCILALAVFSETVRACEFGFENTCTYFNYECVWVCSCDYGQSGEESPPERTALAMAAAA